MGRTVESVWGQFAAERAKTPKMLSWLDSPMVLRLRIHPLIGASEEGNWLLSLAKRMQIPRNGRWLSIACGGGGLELYAVEQRLCTELEGLDVAPGAVEVANRTAAERGLHNAHFHVTDLEHSCLPEDAYDVIMCSMGLHHIRRLEFFCEEIARALKPGGWLLLNEYVGPSQWQWTDAQLDAVNSLLAKLPERYRVHALTREIKKREERPTVEFMNRVDPSEAIRSAEMLTVLRQQFEIVEQRDYGGAVLHKLLEYIVGNFDSDVPEDVELFQSLCETEDALMQAGEIQSDFAVVAARNRKQSFRQSHLPLDVGIERHIVSGIYHVECDRQGVPFCWTAPHAELALRRPIDANALRIRLLMPPVARSLTVSVDGVCVGSADSGRHSSQEAWLEFVLKLPSQGHSQAIVGLRVDEPWAPREVWRNGDARELGVALAEMVVEDWRVTGHVNAAVLLSRTDAQGVFEQLQTKTPWSGRITRTLGRWRRRLSR